MLLTAAAVPKFIQPAQAQSIWITYDFTSSDQSPIWTAVPTHDGRANDGTGDYVPTYVAGTGWETHSHDLTAATGAICAGQLPGEHCYRQYDGTLYSTYNQIPDDLKGVYIPYVMDRGLRFNQPEDYELRGSRPYYRRYSKTHIEFWIAQ